MFFAGRTSDWLRVDGENFPAAPIEAIVGRHPDVMLVSAYGVPCSGLGGPGDGGAWCSRRARRSTAACLPSWLDSQADLSPKWQPRFVRICRTLPSTPTNKILTRTLVHEKFRSDRVQDDPVFRRTRGEASFQPFTQADESQLRDAFDANGRAPVWDL